MTRNIVILLCLLVAKLQSQDFTKQEISIAEDLIGDLYQPKTGKAKVFTATQSKNEIQKLLKKKFPK